MDTIIPQVSVGVDVSKNFLDVHVFPLEEAFRFANDAYGIVKLLSKLGQYQVIRIACEASGGYERLMVKTLMRMSYFVWVVEPKRIRAFIFSEGIRVKTDKVDARMIALFCYHKEPSYIPNLKTDTEEHLITSYQRRNDLVKIRTQESNRLKSPSQEHWKEQIRVLITFLDKQIKEIEAEVIRLIGEDEELKKKAQVLESVPGVGKITALALISGMPELGKIGDKQAASLVGVAPCIQQSGKAKGTSAIIAGRPHIRRVLYMAALSAVRCNPPLRVFYLRLLDNGKRSKVALVAVMRKLITLLNCLMRKGQAWHPVHTK